MEASLVYKGYSQLLCFIIFFAYSFRVIEMKWFYECKTCSSLNVGHWNFEAMVPLNNG